MRTHTASEYSRPSCRLPGIVFGVLLFVGTMLTGIPLFGFIAGFGGLVFAPVHVGFLMVAAIIGAAI